ncbi:MAG: sulfatase family protein, partial [Vicinamibacterales bacterium]
MIRLSAATIFVALGMLACSPDDSSNDTGRSGPPNILFIVSDDQRADSLSCMPKLGQLLRTQGVTFENSFATTPLCCPSRASILTGKYAHRHGVRMNNDSEDGGTAGVPGVVDFDRNGNRELVFVKWLQGAGYRTGLIGKYLNGYELIVDRDDDGDGQADNDVPPYWDSWVAFTREGYHHFQLIEREGRDRAERVCYVPAGERNSPRAKSCREHADSIEDDAENYSTDVLADKAVEFVTRAAADEVPFFLLMAPWNPHRPFTSPARYQPDPDKAAFTPLAMSRLGTCALFDWRDRPPSFLEADVSDKPAWVIDMVGRLGRGKLEEQRRKQLVSALAIEDAVEKVLSALDRSGQRPNTVVIYTSDNAYSWGEHWWDRKNCAYDSCSRVPLVIYDPRFPREAAIQLEMVLNIDLAPTFAELAGISPPSETGVSRMSLVGLAHGTANPWPRDHVLTECWGKFGNCPRVNGCTDIHASVRTIDWKYIEHYED